MSDDKSLDTSLDTSSDAPSIVRNKAYDTTKNDSCQATTCTLHAAVWTCQNPMRRSIPPKSGDLRWTSSGFPGILSAAMASSQRDDYDRLGPALPCAASFSAHRPLRFPH